MHGDSVHSHVISDNIARGKCKYFSGYYVNGEIGIHFIVMSSMIIFVDEAELFGLANNEWRWKVLFDFHVIAGRFITSENHCLGRGTLNLLK
jgi:hypothetical protein